MPPVHRVLTPGLACPRPPPPPTLLPVGQTILVLGAAGGVGLAAVQLSKRFGARVIAVARGHSKMAALREVRTRGGTGVVADCNCVCCVLRVCVVVVVSVGGWVGAPAPHAQ
jgi:NAD(P)-dependent dehydrogenase (short-subunit alcohol dehydrogenase family)